MHTAAALLDVNERTHRCIKGLLDHCRGLTPEELDRELDGFGYPTVRLQLHHALGAQLYWIGVLEGRIDADDNEGEFPDIAALEAYREAVFTLTRDYLRTASVDELNTARPMATWGGREQVLVPAHVVLRTLTHVFQHQGQVTAMCRILGKPVGGLDYSHGQ